MARTAVQLPTSGRKIRRPTHTFNIVHNPWAITPFMIAPVIPGETMRSAVMQARAISSPVKSDMLGWWLEHYMFYVKIRDLEEREDLTQMFVNPEWEIPLGLQDTTANPDFYHNGRGRINWPKLCLNRVVAEYFRDEGEAVDIATYGGLPLAKANTVSVFDSLMSEGDYEPIGDVPLDINADGEVTAGEAAEAMRQWTLLREMNLTEATYEDFIRSFGVRGQVAEKIEPHRPELVRYEKQWTYPANTVEVSGVRTVASWSSSLRADKDRFFAEPGFLFGVTVARPKVYLGNQSAAAVSLLDHIQTWLPAVLRPDPSSSLVHVPNGTGPIDVDPTGYYVDIRDLYIHGDQFINHALPSNAVAVPNPTNFDTDYVTSSDIEGLFVGTTPETRIIRQDGICTFMIASAETKDYTAKTGRAIDFTA